ncbi:hypothetical protein [Aliidiomarina quisquiliarum]|uniref:hypothetical protein n=1 Tax=Aliidiomarina quisquiliarum TaxID=2938947 RepID=UPI00208F1DAC|nr:hypothetical protein [Aliidiomarina quisquiliarum]MCO4320877.1 hypothetical protein [Aliidiomarina quisquiliarum]
MSKLDKEKVLSEFSDAYKVAHGTAPNVEESSGWYSVEGSKNMRLAKLAEWTAELNSGKAEAAPAATKAKPVVKPSAKTTPAVSAEAVVNVTHSAGGLSAKELWQQRLEQTHIQNRLPRGFQQAGN